MLLLRLLSAKFICDDAWVPGRVRFFWLLNIGLVDRLYEARIIYDLAEPFRTQVYREMVTLLIDITFRVMRDEIYTLYHLGGWGL